MADGSVDARASGKNLEQRIQALYCLAESADSIQEGVELARQVESEASGLEQADALLWRASAELYLARPGAGSDADRCGAAKQAAQAADQARQMTSEAEKVKLLARISHDSGIRQASIPGCGA